MRAAVACAVAGTMGVVGATSASAHATAVSGVAQCAVDGTITVSWKIQNDYAVAVDVTGQATGGGSLAGLPAQIASTSGKGNTSITATQSGIPVGGSVASLNVNGTWADGFKASASGRVSLPGECTPPEKATTPVAPRIAQADECDVEGTVTVPSTEGVRYLWNGKDVSGETLTGPLDGVVRVEVKDGFVLSEGAKSEFPVKVAPAAVCDTVVTPVVPQITQSDKCDVEGAVTVPTTEGVHYLWDGKDVSGQTLTGPLKGVIKVEVQDGFELVEGAKTEFPIDVAPAEVCDTLVTPVAPEISQSDECEVNGTVTIPEIEGVSYFVEDEELEPGTYEGPADVTITAAASEGYTLTGTSSWDVVLTEAQECEEGSTPAPTPTGTPTPRPSYPPLAYTGAGDTLPLSLLAMGLLALGGGVVMVARRRGSRA
ncbi:hypothetical protein ACOCJ7_10175 [Knoellia sp. CPCC 206453]|uniref:hypothetical protein n=1 Tax=Knoellia pratensis TaxID=3404796 RepID=UPI003616D099